MPRKPRVDVIERGIQSDAVLDPEYNKLLARRIANPFGVPSAEIELKDPNLEPRWFNGGVGEDHIWRAKQNGWKEVTIDMVVDPDQLGGYKLQGQVIVRGERGQERLMCMPRVARTAIQAAKTEANNRNLKNPNRQKRDIAEAAASAVSEQAADFLDGNLQIGHAQSFGDVTTSYERVERREAE